MNFSKIVFSIIVFIILSIFVLNNVCGEEQLTPDFRQYDLSIS